MEQSLGFAHFLRSADPVAMFILAVLLVMSVGSWYLIFTKGWRIAATRRRSDAFVRQFWDAPDIGAVAERLRATGAADPFSHLVHHGFTALGASTTQRHTCARITCTCTRMPTTCGAAPPRPRPTRSSAPSPSCGTT